MEQVILKFLSKKDYIDFITNLDLTYDYYENEEKSKTEYIINKKLSWWVREQPLISGVAIGVIISLIINML